MSILRANYLNLQTGELRKARRGELDPKVWEIVPKPIMVKEKDGRFHAKIPMKDFVIDIIENVEGDDEQVKKEVKNGNTSTEPVHK